MLLTQEHRDTFERDGCALIGDVLDDEIRSVTDRAICHLYDTGEKSDGIICHSTDPGLNPLLQYPPLEEIAKYILETDQVVLNSAAILFSRPLPGKELELYGEHVDIMYSREEWEARPRQVICMLMVMLADLPEGRANTYARIGSHMQLADWCAQEGREPLKTGPTHQPDFPDLDWQPLTPIVAKAGQVIAFNTNLIHTGSTNVDTEARRIMFINFCPRGKISVCNGHPGEMKLMAAWRNSLQESFSPERQHLLLEDDE
jgi:hypothetical protein